MNTEKQQEETKDVRIATAPSNFEQFWQETDKDFRDWLGKNDIMQINHYHIIWQLKKEEIQKI